MLLVYIFLFLFQYRASYIATEREKSNKCSLQNSEGEAIASHSASQKKERERENKLHRERFVQRDLLLRALELNIRATERTGIYIRVEVDTQEPASQQDGLFCRSLRHNTQPAELATTEHVTALNVLYTAITVFVEVRCRGENRM